MISMKMSEGGRVVIPVEIRRKLALKEGDSVLWDFKDGVATLTTRLAQLREAQAMVRRYVPASVSLADELIAERRAENAAEEGRP
jgi:AbrB family looped-hinge helix DNA binding protein